MILQLSETFPKKWALMAKQLKGRTENAVKIRYYSLMRKRKRNSEGGGGSGSGHGSSPGKRSSSGSSSRTIKKVTERFFYCCLLFSPMNTQEKISPQSAKGFSNPSGGATVRRSLLNAPCLPLDLLTQIVYGTRTALSTSTDFHSCRQPPWSYNNRLHSCHRMG